MPELLATMIEIHDALDSGGIAHAFGGALALMWCTGEPRTTMDIDINIFTSPSQMSTALDSLPEGVTISALDREALEQDGQRRLFYDDLAVDVFFNTTAFHRDLQIHTRTHEVGGRRLPFLGCNDLAVLKALFNRRKDWADIEEMIRAKQLDVEYVLGVITSNLGPDDQRIKELLTIRAEIEASRD
jgi:hypothetical protein